jgi:hypothetical protein
MFDVRPIPVSSALLLFISVIFTFVLLSLLVFAELIGSENLCLLCPSLSQHYRPHYCMGGGGGRAAIQPTDCAHQNADWTKMSHEDHPRC